MSEGISEKFENVIWLLIIVGFAIGIILLPFYITRAFIRVIRRNIYAGSMIYAIWTGLFYLYSTIHVTNYGWITGWLLMVFILAMAAIDGYHFPQFPAIDSLFLVSQAVSIISSETLM